MPNYLDLLNLDWLKRPEETETDIPYPARVNPPEDMQPIPAPAPEPTPEPLQTRISPPTAIPAPEPVLVPPVPMKSPERSEQQDYLERLKELQEQRREALRRAAFGELGAGIGNAFIRSFGVTPSDSSGAFKQIRQEAELPLQEYKEQLSEKERQRQEKLKGLQTQEMEDLYSPTSNISKIYQEAAKKLPLFQGQDVTQYNAKQLSGMGIKIQKPSTDLSTWQQYMMARDLRKEKQHEREFGTSEERRQSQKTEKEIENMSQRMEKSQILEQTRIMSELNRGLRALGGSIDRAPTADIPGIGATGWAPGFLTSAKGINFRQNIQGLANMLLKTRSGAAVTPKEYDRFLEEASGGKFGTDQDVISGIRKMRDDLLQRTQNIESINPGALKEWETRTGLPLPSTVLKQTKAQGMIMKDPKTGKRYEVNPDTKQIIREVK